MSDHIAKVNPAGVIADGYMLEISAWVIPPMRYGDPGVDTTAVKMIVRIAVISGRNLIIMGFSVV